MYCVPLCFRVPNVPRRRGLRSPAEPRVSFRFGFSENIFFGLQLAFFASHFAG